MITSRVITDTAITGIVITGIAIASIAATLTAIYRPESRRSFVVVAGCPRVKPSA
jgi:hypothetical protein